MRKSVLGFLMCGFAIGWILFSKPIEALISFVGLYFIIEGIMEEYHYVGKARRKSKN